MNSLGIIALLAATASFQGSRYDDCVALVEGDLEVGRIAAQQWVTEGGGANARHCLAMRT
jgi:hypothetical protein